MKSVTPSKCLCDFCHRDASSRGYCHAHYKHLLKNIAPYPIKERRPRVSNTGKCTVDSCPERQKAGGYCSMHYEQLRIGKVFNQGRYRAAHENHKKICIIAGCKSSRSSGAGCSQHCSTAKKYGLTIIQLQMIIDLGCQICGASTNRMHIDHDHACCDGVGSCGRCIRGGLCHGCNVGIGFFVENVETTQKAIDYLNRK